MKKTDLQYKNLQGKILKPYTDRAPTVSGQFLKWFLENIYRLDAQEADDASVDSALDKGIDAIYVDNESEIITLIQSKVRQKANSTLGDTDLKEFSGSIKQFESEESIQNILDGNASKELKSSILRTKIIEKIKDGYVLSGVFCTNLSSNKDAKQYLKSNTQILLYDANRISAEYVELGLKSGVKKKFVFDVSDSDVIKYQSKNGVVAKIFLASASDLVNLEGISDGKLFEQNVRLSLGSTKINKSLVDSIKKVEEHQNFPFYHNGITILCDKFGSQNKNKLEIDSYMVVNGAQSITALHNTKQFISQDLKVLTKVVALKGDATLSGKITHNSNNQNAIKARDLRSNHPIQERLQLEVRGIDHQKFRYEVKRGEDNTGFNVISNENAGLVLLAMDIGEPWSCHQKYRVMDDLHGRIFGRPNVDGYKIIGMSEGFNSILPALENIEDRQFATYNLTKYFLAFSVADIVKNCYKKEKIFEMYREIVKDKKLDQLNKILYSIAETTAVDLSVNIEEAKEDDAGFDYKASLKSPRWCSNQSKALVAAYKKDVKRKKADDLGEVFKEFWE